MSIAAANLFTRNIYRDLIRPAATPAEEAKVSKLVSLLVGWGAGMLYGTTAAYRVSTPTMAHFAGAVARAPFIGTAAYIGLTAAILNILVAAVLTVVLRALRAGAGHDATAGEDYLSDAVTPSPVLATESG